MEWGTAAAWVSAAAAIGGIATTRALYRHSQKREKLARRRLRDETVLLIEGCLGVLLQACDQVKAADLAPGLGAMPSENVCNGFQNGVVMLNERLEADLDIDLRSLVHQVIGCMGRAQQRFGALTPVTPEMRPQFLVEMERFAAEISGYLTGYRKRRGLSLPA